MNARVFQPVAPPETGVVAWSWRALALAAGAGLLAVVSPPASLLALALLAARALVHSPNRQLELSDFAGPLLATLIAGAFVGISGAVGVIFAWRLFSDARWSIGESRRLAALAGLPPQRLWASELHLWLTPAFGLALVAYTSPHMIAGLPLDLPHVPLMIPVAVGCLAAGASFDWLLRRAVDWRLGEGAPAPTAHMLTHHVLFLGAYGLGLDISAGIVALAAWRLLQAAPIGLGYLAVGGYMDDLKVYYCPSWEIPFRAM